MYEGAFTTRAQKSRAQAHRTLTYFLAELYWDRTVRATAGQPGAWENRYPVRTGEGRNAGYVPIKGMDLDRPVAVHLSRDRRNPRFWAVVFDHDAKRVSAGQAAVDAEVMAGAMRAEGIEPVPAASGSPGGIHLWSGCAETVGSDVVARINAAAARLCPSLDPVPLSNPTDALIRPPGAAHRTGGYSALTAHTVEEAVRLLGRDSAPASAFERLAVRLETMAASLPPEQAGEEPSPVPGPRRPLGDRARGQAGRTVPPSIERRGPCVRQIVTDEAGCPRLDVPWRPLGERAMRGLRRRLARVEDHSAHKHAPARSMALAGWSQAQALAVVRDAASSPALEYLRSERQADGSRRARSKEETERLWARVWALAVEDAARMPRRPEDDGRTADAEGDVRQAVTGLFARMRAAGPARWARESGPADAAILAALAFLMLLSGTTDVSANVRRLGVLAGYTGQTASQALWRLTRDGWLTVTADADRRAGKARRYTLATSHECTDHHRHQCAIYTTPDDVSPGHPGSDRSGTRAAPAPPTSSLPRSPDVGRAHLTLHQAGVWHDLGHHAARTFWAIQQHARPRLADLMTATGYGRRATLRHLHQFQDLKLVTQGPSRRGEPTYAVTGRSLYEAAQETGSPTRIAHMATEARVDQAVHVWLEAELEHRSLPYAQRPRRASAEQTVIPGMDPRGREYPRDENGRLDHDRAREIEARRIGASGILAHAQQLAQAGELIDPPHLSATGADQPKPARRAGRRPVIASRYHCSHCGAKPGERCTKGGTEARRFGALLPAARWHAARRREAQAQQHHSAERPTELRHTRG